LIDFEALFRSSPNPYMLVDRDLRYVDANDAYLRVTASKREQLIGRPIFEVFPNDPDDPENDPARLIRASFERVFATGEPDSVAFIRYRVPRHTATGLVDEDRYWSATHTPMFDAEGRVAMVLQHTVDVTELHRLNNSSTAQMGVLARAEIVQAENISLDAERRRLRALFDQAPGFMCILRGPDFVFELANGAYIQLVGGRDVVGKTLADALPEVIDQGFKQLLDRVRESGKPFRGTAVPVVLAREPGALPEERYVDFVYQPVHDERGVVEAIFVQGHDITDQKRAENELRVYREQLEELVRDRTRELQRAEAELRQAQRMEAVGKLTGGVAHDFNNLLQVIGGNLQLLQSDVTTERADRRVRTAITAVERGAKLASQLLAFARRQPLEPTVINLARVVRDIDDLIRRPLGEDIVLETDIAGDLWNTFADRNQVENAILNLAINARDAMKGSGTLKISARNEHLTDTPADTPAGEYVCLELSDTGCGMEPEVMERAFEPFFTTKPAGEGTGLGLSMVYGFVKQTGGHVAIASEFGRGTTIRIYLPRSYAKETEVPVEAAVVSARGTETILVVEDDSAVRSTVVEMLGELGYKVLEAPNPEVALQLLNRGTVVDLLFSDVVMPGQLRAPELARRAKVLLPNLEVLFTSGYAQDAIVHEGRLDAGVNLLRKPYSKEELARKVRQLLRTRKNAPLRILLVEDDDDLRYATEQMLVVLGHAVAGVGTAKQADAALAREPFDVLLTDVNLPDVSGVELARRAVEKHARLRVVFATGDAAPADPWC
jgi:PAS domain S-box-containing protein